MRILFYSVEFGGPTTTFIRNELEYFSKNHEIIYLCHRAKDGVELPTYVKVIPFLQNKFGKKLRWMLWQKDIMCNNYSRAYSRIVRSVVKEFKPDVIHCHFAYEGLYLLDNLGKLRFKTIFHFHGYDASQMTRKKSYIKRLKHVLNLPNVFPISCNRYFAEHLSTITGISISRFFILYCGVDLELFKPSLARKVSNNEKIFLQVSSLSTKKGHEYTLRAFASLSSKCLEGAYRLIITGDGERKNMLQELAESLGVRQNVEFLGTVTPKEVVALMKKADVFVHHSITAENGDMEGIPNSLIEAMAMELPVISTWHSGIPELVEDKINGYLVQEKDVDGYTRSMKAALDWTGAAINRQKIAKEFNLDVHNSVLERFYMSLSNCNI